MQWTHPGSYPPNKFKRVPSTEILPHPKYSPDLAPQRLLPVSKTENQALKSNGGIMKTVNEFFEDQNTEFYFKGSRVLIKKFLARCTSGSQRTQQMKWSYFSMI
jgi:hypothetical protein